VLLLPGAAASAAQTDGACEPLPAKAVPHSGNGVMADFCVLSYILNVQTTVKQQQQR
jgi:hypothetical protein